MTSEWRGRGGGGEEKKWRENKFRCLISIYYIIFSVVECFYFTTSIFFSFDPIELCLKMKQGGDDDNDDDKKKIKPCDRRRHKDRSHLIIWLHRKK